MNLTHSNLTVILTILAIACAVLLVLFGYCTQILSDRNFEIRCLKGITKQLTENVATASELRKIDSQGFTKEVISFKKNADLHAAAMLELRAAYDKSTEEIAGLKKYITSLRDRLSYISDCTKSNFPIPRNSLKNNPFGDLYHFLTEGFDKPILEHLTEQDTPACTSSRTHSRQ